MAQLIPNQDDFLSVMFKRDMTVTSWYVEVPVFALNNNSNEEDEEDFFLWEFEGNGLL